MEVRLNRAAKYLHILILNASNTTLVKGLNPAVISRLSIIVQVNVVLKRTVVDSHWRFDNLFGSNLQSQRELSYVSWWH